MVLIFLQSLPHSSWMQTRNSAASQYRRRNAYGMVTNLLNVSAPRVETRPVLFLTASPSAKEKVLRKHLFNSTNGKPKYSPPMHCKHLAASFHIQF